jgi:hypothetical protein
MQISAGKPPKLADDIRGCLQPVEESIGPVNENKRNLSFRYNTLANKRQNWSENFYNNFCYPKHKYRLPTEVTLFILPFRIAGNCGQKKYTDLCKLPFLVK